MRRAIGITLTAFTVIMTTAAIVIWSVIILLHVAPAWSTRQILRIAAPECIGAAKNVPYHDGMTLCPGQSAEYHIQLMPTGRP